MVKMYVAFSVDNNYADPLCVTIYSLLKNNKKNELSIYILYNNLTYKNKGKLLEVGKLFNTHVEFIKIDRTLFENFPLYQHFTLESYFRYLLPDLLKDLNRLLYLDVDILILKDLAELWNVDITGFYLAGSEDPFVRDSPHHREHKQKLGLKKNDLYINAGVLLLNLEKIRQDHMVPLLFKNTTKYAKVIQFSDQDVINVTFRGGIRQVEEIYNNFGLSLGFDSKNSHLLDILPETAIVHFPGPEKPWLLHNYPRRAFFAKWYEYEYEYYKATGWLKSPAYRNMQDINQIESQEILSRIPPLEERIRLELKELYHYRDNPSLHTVGLLFWRAVRCTMQNCTSRLKSKL